MKKNAHTQRLQSSLSAVERGHAGQIWQFWRANGGHIPAGIRGFKATKDASVLRKADLLFRCDLGAIWQEADDNDYLTVLLWSKDDETLRYLVRLILWWKPDDYEELEAGQIGPWWR